MPIVKCQICSNKFYVKPFHQNKGWGKFCSKFCAYKNMRNGIFVKCVICKKLIYRTPKNFKNSQSNNFFCSKNCFAKWKNSHLLIGENHGRWKNGINACRSILRRTGIMPKCERCAINDLRVLVAHHIDRNRDNNRISNLMWLCRNCHYLEHKGKTF